MIKLKHPILLLSLAAVMVASTAAIASAATTNTTTTRVDWSGSGWSCAVRASTPVPTGNGYGLRHVDGFASCLKNGYATPVAHISLITCFQTSVDGRRWTSAWCSTASNAVGAASADANITQACGAGYHQVRTQVTATALQPTYKLVAKYATATSKVIGCRGA